ncbi:MAG: ABC transporter substrate-binding protein [Microbacteriaceae bacterium]
MRSPSRSRRVARGLFVAVAAVAALALAACSTTTDGPSDDVDQTFVIGSTMSAFPSLDSGAITTGGYEAQRLIGNLIYEGLTKRDVSDPDSPAGVAPALAESWDVSEDGLTYTMHLREGVVFHDGTAFDADAVVFNLERYTDESNPYYSESVVTYYSVLDRLTGFTAVDASTVELTLAEPYSFFLADLYNVYIASPTSLEESGAEGQASHPVGTGPFAFDSVSGNEQLTMVRNDDWWGDGPLLDTIVVKLIPDSAARVAALRAGSVDWIESVSPDDIASLEAAGFQVTSQAYDMSWFWWLKVDEEPFDDVRVRQAINYAIDREALADGLLGGTAVPTGQLLTPANVFYDESAEVYDYDPDRAIELLTEAGYPDGIDVKIGYRTSGSGTMQPQSMNEALQAQLAEVGIRVTLEPVEGSSMTTRVTSGDNDWQGWNAPLSLEQPGSWGFIFRCGESRNGYCNPEAEALLDEALATVDTAEQTALMQQVAAIITEDAPWLFVVADTAPRAMSAAVAGYEQPMSWWVEFNSVYLTE